MGGTWRLHRAHSCSALIKIEGAEQQEQEGTRRDQRPRDARHRMQPFLCCAACTSSPHLVPLTSMLDAWSPGTKAQGYRPVFSQVSWILCSVYRLKPRCPQLRRSLSFPLLWTRDLGSLLNVGQEVF